MTIEEAEKVYKKNNCSVFVMAREDLNNYILYKNLNIDIALEQKWRVEVIEDLVNLLEKDGDSRVFNQLYDLSASFHDKERLNIMMHAIENVKIKDAKTSLCIAETIMGRKSLSIRSGMIFWAYDIGAKEEAVILINTVISLINIQTDESEELARVNRNQKRIGEIANVLGIELLRKSDI